MATSNTQVGYKLNQGILTIDSSCPYTIKGLLNSKSNITEVVIEGQHNFENCFNDCNGLLKIRVTGDICFYTCFNNCSSLEEIYIKCSCSKLIFACNTFNNLGKLHTVTLLFSSETELTSSFDNCHPKFLTTKHCSSMDSYCFVPSEHGKNVIASRLDGIQYQKVYVVKNSGRWRMDVKTDNILHLVYKYTKSKNTNGRDLEISYNTHVLTNLKYLLIEGFGGILKLSSVHYISELKMVYLNRGAAINGAEFMGSGAAYPDGTLFLLENGANTNVFTKYGLKYKFVSGLDEALQIIQADFESEMKAEREALIQCKKLKMLGISDWNSLSYIRNIQKLLEIKNTLSQIEGSKLEDKPQTVNFPGLDPFEVEGTLASKLSALAYILREENAVDHFKIYLSMGTVLDIPVSEEDEQFNTLSNIVTVRSNLDRNTSIVIAYLNGKNLIKISHGGKAVRYILKVIGTSAKIPRHLSNFISNYCSPVSVKYVPGDTITETTYRDRFKLTGIMMPEDLYFRINREVLSNLYILDAYRVDKVHKLEIVVIDMSFGKVLVLKNKMLLKNTDVDNILNGATVFTPLQYSPIFAKGRKRAQGVSKVYEVLEVYQNIEEFLNKHPKNPK